MLDMRKVVFSIVVFFSITLFADLFNVHGVYLDDDSGIWALCSGMRGDSWQEATEKLTPSVVGVSDGNRPLSDFSVPRRIMFILDSRGKLTLNERDLYRSFFNVLPIGEEDEVGIISFGSRPVSNPVKKRNSSPSVYSLLKPTSDREQLQQALVSYEALFSSGPDYTVRALTEALSALNRDVANASFREAIILILHKMPQTKEDLKDALDGVMRGNGMKVPVFALVLGSEQKLDRGWRAFFEGTGGQVVCVDEMTITSFLKGTIELFKSWDSQQGFLYSRNDSLENQTLSRSVSLSYCASVEGEQATIEIPLAYQDRLDVLNGRIQKDLLKKVQQLTVFDEQISGVLKAFIEQINLGNYPDAQGALDEIAGFVTQRHELLSEAEELSKNIQGSVTVDFVRLRKTNREMSDRVDDYGLLLSKLVQANKFFVDQQESEAKGLYELLIVNPLLPAIEKARIFFVLAEISDEKKRYNRQGIALIESEMISGHHFSSDIFLSYTWALVGEGRSADAERHVMELQKQRTDVNPGKFNFVYGVALYKQGHVNRAAVYIEKAIASDPQYKKRFKNSLAE